MYKCTWQPSPKLRAKPIYLCSGCKEKADRWGTITTDSTLL